MGRLEQVPDAAGEVALEAADGFFGAFAFGAFAGDVVLGLGVAAQARDGDAVDGGVDLAVAAAVEAVAVGLARADGDRSDADQVTPEHPRPATSDTAKGGQAQRPTASKRVSSPPV